MAKKALEMTLSCALAASLSTPAWGQQSAPPEAQPQTADSRGERYGLSVELDPLAYVFKGYGGALAYQVTPHVRLSLHGFVVGELPEFITNQPPNEGFTQSLNGYAVWALYNFWERRSSPFIGALYERRFHRLTHKSEPGKVGRQSRSDLLPTVGYRWEPVSNWGLYLLPWFGFGIPFAEKGDVTVGSRSFKPRTFDWFLTFHIGWEL